MPCVHDEVALPVQAAECVLNLLLYARRHSRGVG
jgi:hypothetical protein